MEIKNKKENTFFDILQIFRGVAAFMVVIHHTYTSFEYYHHLDIPLLHYIASIGKYGVDFFFVLSGFIIAYSTYKYREDKSYLKKYIFNRFVRIYVPYLPMSILMITLYFVFPSISNSERDISLLTSLTLIPYGNPALAVAWTLIFEMFFYTVFALNFISKKTWAYFLIIWIGIILYFNVNQVKTDEPFISLITSLYNFEFVFGVLIAYLVKNNVALNKSVIFSAILFCFSIFLFLSYSNIELFSFSLNIFFSLSVALLIYYSVFYYNKSFKKNNFAVLLGNSSYSLYLTHSLIQVALVRLIPTSQITTVTLLSLVFVVIICCIIGYVYYYIFEKKGIDLVKLKMKNYI